MQFPQTQEPFSQGTQVPSLEPLSAVAALRHLGNHAIHTLWLTNGGPMKMEGFFKMLVKLPIVKDFKANMAHNNSSMNQDGEPGDFLIS